MRNFRGHLLKPTADSAGKPSVAGQPDIGQVPIFVQSTEELHRSTGYWIVATGRPGQANPRRGPLPLASALLANAMGGQPTAGFGRSTHRCCKVTITRAGY